jgi:excisionase family DNA binding protein
MTSGAVLEADELLTSAQAARVLGVTPDRVRQLADAGQLPVALRTAAGRLLRASDVAALAAARQARRQGAA